MRDLLVIVCSRGRPERMRQWVKEFEFTSTRGYTDVVVALDNDDPTLDQYTTWLGVGVEWEVGRPNGFAPRQNAEAVARADNYFAIASLGDDLVPRTQNWDEIMVQHLKHLGTGIAYGDDLLQREALPTAPFMTSDIVRTLGWMSPPCLDHMYVDNFWLELGQQIDRLVFDPAVIIEHMHPGAGKAEVDESYARTNSAQSYARDRDAWSYYRRNGFWNDVNRVRGLL